MSCCVMQRFFPWGCCSQPIYDNMKWMLGCVMQLFFSLGALFPTYENWKWVSGCVMQLFFSLGLLFPTYENWKWVLGCVMQLFFSLVLLFPTYDKISVLVIYFELNDKIVRRSDSNTNYSKRQDTKKGRKFLIPSLIRLYNLSYFSGVQLVAWPRASTG
jgi:hypothetical protein